MILEEPLFVGGVNWSQSNRTFPPEVWSINMRAGFVGCLKSVRVNGISATLALAYQQQMATTQFENGSWDWFLRIFKYFNRKDTID
jgi:hypothetical protein